MVSASTLTQMSLYKHSVIATELGAKKHEGLQEVSALYLDQMSYRGPQNGIQQCLAHQLKPGIVLSPPQPVK